MSLRNRCAIRLSVDDVFTFGDLLALVVCLREWRASMGGMSLWLTC